MKKILILSNDIEDSLLFNKVFEMMGYESLMVTTTQNAWSSLQESQTDLITMILPLDELEEEMRGGNFTVKLKMTEISVKYPS